MEQKKTVLIVEDEKNIVDILRFNLQREGYATLEAYDGEAGLTLAREKKPDILLLDVMMPKMMGFDVCRALREEGDNVPVIILPAREEEEDKILGLDQKRALYNHISASHDGKVPPAALEAELTEILSGDETKN